MMNISIDHIITVIINVLVVFIGGRLMYGYWPWQLHPVVVAAMANDRAKVKAPGAASEPEETVMPVVTLAQDNGNDTFDRTAEQEK